MKRRNRGKCYLCGKDGALEHHHVIPKSMGGTATIPICPLCHMKLTAPVKSELTRLGIRNLRRHEAILLAIAVAIDKVADGVGYEDVIYYLTERSGLEELANAVEAVI
ncbi:MAG: hypothetical protein IKE76_11770 [Clostridia bacterium]|nr:hypothetical protein [Clostridia bacterium]